MGSDPILLSIIALLATLLLVLLCYVVRARLHRRRQLRFLFSAFDNHDFAYRFPSGARHGEFHDALNRIRQLLFQAREEVMESEEYYRLILQMVHTGILVVDSQGRVLRCNAAAKRMLGRQAITHISQVEAALHSGHFSISRSQARLRGKEVQLLAVSDISHALAQREQESWEKLIRVLTHEIMNSVSPVTSLCHTLLQRIDSASGLSTPQLRQGLDTICATSHHLTQFVHQYRRLTLLPPARLRAFEASPFLHHIVELAQAYPGAQGIAMSVQVEPAQLMLYADEALLARVCTNIMKNAVEALQATPSPCIQVTAGLEPGEVVYLHFTNNGPLIPPEEAEQIFVPFFTTKPTGSGIGLSLCARLVQQMQGQLTLLPQAPTTFRICFE